MEKILKSHTIIPSELYVERDADKQIASIINDMGRPGYILVARQMGKTNLLLNAKRTLERDGDIFAYIDLSNKFDDARECFRNIIDIIIDTNSETLADAKDKIINKRQVSFLTPHKEHGHELREVLNHISGKLIINLDEIDSLTAADYSDKVFAQIRSIYFERINFPIFERLSYILSGVAEPSDIIKDRSISPFNIGQKIFLSDFSYKEYEWFIDKAKLEISNEVKERIFYWANGNPRMTWEICSEIEDLLPNVVDVNSTVVDKLIKDMYLSKYDRPPVDHIRTLIQSRKDLRQGIIAINYKKFETLTDDVKNGLYLAGVIGSSYEQGNVVIKNKIIEKSLDDKWLQEIDDADSISIDNAQASFDDGDYVRAIKLYKELLKDPSTDADHKHITYQLGLSYYNSDEFDEAIKYLSNSLFDKDSFKGLYVNQIYIIAISYLRLNNAQKAKPYFEEIISFGKKTKNYFESHVSLVSALLKEDYVKHSEKIQTLLLHVIDECTSDHESYHEVVSASLYHLAKFEEFNKDFSKSYEHYLASSEIAVTSNKIRPLLSALKLDINDGEELFSKIINVIKGGDVKLSPGSGYTLDFDSSTFKSLILVVTARKYFDQLKELLNYTGKYLVDEHFILSEILVEVGIDAIVKNDIKTGKYLLELLIDFDRANAKPDVYFMGAKYLFYISQDNTRASDVYFQGYQNYVETPDVIDVMLFERAMTEYFHKKENDKALSLCSRILLSLSEYPKPLQIRLLYIRYIKLLCLTSQGETLLESNDLYNFMITVDKNDLHESNFNSEMFENIKLYAYTAIISLTPIEKLEIIKKKFERNEKVTVKYAEGHADIGKYKKLSSDIEAGICAVVSLKIDNKKTIEAGPNLNNIIGKILK